MISSGSVLQSKKLVTVANQLKNCESEFGELKIGRCTDFDADTNQVIKKPFKNGCFDLIGT